MGTVITVDTTLSERYHLEALVGRGGMADVYRARDRVLERPVAVKVVRGASEEDGRRFAREIRAMAALSHSGIVQIFDAGTHDDAPYLVMELIEGSSLPDLLADGPLDHDKVVGLGRQLARALAHAHDLGVVHRDVKPANVLVGADGRPRLSDFGIARLADATRVTTPGMTSGTAAYLAPEQLEGDDVGPPADVYSLGLVLLEALTGRREFTGTAVEAAMARLHRDPVVDDDLGAPWDTLLPAMTARDPDARPRARQVADRLSGHTGKAGDDGDAGTHGPDRAETVALRAGAPAGERPAGDEAEEPAGGPSGPRRWTTAVVAGLLVAAAVVALLVVNATNDGDGGPPPPETSQDTDLPADLDDALRRLEEAVRP